MENLKLWIQKNRWECLLLLFILVTTLALRLYKIDQYMTFLGDEGRDAIVIKDLLVNHHFPFIGPPTSVGNMYNGPLYYYMMGVAMLIGWLNPISAAVMVAIIGTLTVGLIYYLTREWFGKISAVIASVLYALSPVTIIYSRSSWNPNPAPFFALLSFVGIYFSRKSNNFLWFILTGVSVAFAVQMHALALLLIPIFGLLWFYELYFHIKKKKRKYLIEGTVGAIVGFLLFMSPLVLFDFKHNFMNYRAFVTFFFGDRATTVNLNIFNTFGRVPHVLFDMLIRDHFAVDQIVLILLILIFILFPVVWYIYQAAKNKKDVYWPILACLLWLSVGVMGLSLYKQSIFDHYLTFMNPVPFILLGAGWPVFLKIKNNLLHKGSVTIFIGLCLLIVGFEIMHSPLQYTPNNQLQKTQEIAKYVINLSGNKPFNFALISEHNYDAAYQFYLDQYGHKPAMLPFTKTDQLLVVCEDAECKPVGHPKQEIAAFGWTQIELEQNYDGVKIFKLIPYQGSKTSQ